MKFKEINISEISYSYTRKSLCAIDTVVKHIKKYKKLYKMAVIIIALGFAMDILDAFLYTAKYLIMDATGLLLSQLETQSIQQVLMSCLSVIIDTIRHILILVLNIKIISVLSNKYFKFLKRKYGIN